MKENQTKEPNKSFHSFEMYNLCKGNSNKCSFDFSNIPFSSYHSFFLALPKFIYNKVKSIEFNLDTKQIYLNSSNKTTAIWKCIQDSIFIHQPHFMQYVLKILCYVLPKTKTLQSLSVKQIHINHIYILEFFEACNRSSSLTSLFLFDVKIREEFFRSFLKKASPYHYTSLHFINCNLSDSLFDDIIEFLTKKPNDKLLQWKLSEFDISNNKFSQNQINIIQKIVNQEGYIWAMRKC